MFLDIKHQICILMSHLKKTESNSVDLDTVCFKMFIILSLALSLYLNI